MVAASVNTSEKDIENESVKSTDTNKIWKCETKTEQTVRS